MFKGVCLLVISVLRIRRHALRASLLILMWCDHVSHRSNVRPKYLVDWEVKIWILSKDTSGPGGMRRVKLVWRDLDCNILKRHLTSYEVKMELKVEGSYMWIIMDRDNSLVVGKFGYSYDRRCGLVGSEDII
jgi:hypothetical protein